MSRRLPASTLVLTFLFVGAGILVPFLSTPAEAYGERPKEWNQGITVTFLPVWSSAYAAQSFVATETYRLTNVTLRLQDGGSTPNSMDVSVRTDGGGAPSGTILASATTSSAPSGSPGTVSVPFASPPTLAKGVRYWIVATATTGSSPEAYRWYEAPDGGYPGGTAMSWTVATGWIGIGADLYFLTSGRTYDANLTAALAVSSGAARVKDLVTFTVYYNNTGDTVAHRVWINETLPAGLAFVSDTAGGNGAFPTYVFQDVPNGPHNFTITARVNIGAVPGTVLTSRVDLAYTNSTGTLRPPSWAVASVTVGIVSKQLYLAPATTGPDERLVPFAPAGGLGSIVSYTLRQSDNLADAVEFDLDPALARTFRTTSVTVTLYLDSQSSTASNLDTNLTLLDLGATLTPLAYVQRRVTTDGLAGYQRFDFTFPLASASFLANHVIKLRILNRGSSTDDMILATNSTLTPSRMDLLTTTYLQTTMELRDATSAPALWSTRDLLVVRTTVTDPLGSGDIAGTRVNITAPGGGLVVSYQPMSLLSTDPVTPSAWKVFEYILPPNLLEGTYGVEIASIEANGVMNFTSGSALVRVPRFTFTKVSDAPIAKGGDRFYYHVWYNNTGSGIAPNVWINDTLPAELNFINATPVGGGAGNNRQWSFTSVGPGSYRIDIRVQVLGSASSAFFTNTASLDYTDEKGYRSSATPASATVVLRGPLVALSKTSPQADLHANESITYTFVLANSGDVAQTLWLNDTLPTGLAFVSDTSSSLGAVRTILGNTIAYVLTGLPATTTWTFTLTARGAGNLVPGQILTNRASLNYTNVNGFLMPPTSASNVLTVREPRIASAAIVIPSPTADPGDVVPMTVDFTNAGNEAARSVWVNLTLDPGLDFVNASVAATVIGSDLRFLLANVPAAPQRIYVNLTLVPGVSDRQGMSVQGTLVYSDSYGNRFPTTGVSPDGVTATAPSLALDVSPGHQIVEAATRATFTVSHTNAGSGTAGDVWLNLSLPAGFLYVSDAAGVSPSVQGSRFSWHWTGQAPGPASFDVVLAAKPRMTDASTTDVVFDLAYTDANGHLRERTNATSTVTFAAPTITLGLRADRTEILAGGAVSFTLVMHNTGSTTAREVWLTDPVDSQFRIVSWDSRVPATGEGTQTLNWTFADFAPGAEETVTLVVRAGDDLPPRYLIANSFEAVFTNSEGTVLGYARSTPVTITIVADVLPLLYILLGGIAAGAVAVYFVHRRHSISIEEVFLVYRDGVLIYHLSRSILQDKDEDVLSGMLTAVQEFVRDAFRYGQHRELHQLEFGDYRILIERGKSVYLAVVYSGADSTGVRKKVRSVLDTVETTYGKVLETWDGDMEKVVGARDLIREHLLKNGRALKGRGAAT